MLLLLAASAEAAPPIDPARLLPQKVDKVMVVVLPPTPDSRNVESTLIDALLASGRVRAAFRSDVLGSIDGLDQATLERRSLSWGPRMDSVLIGRASGGGDVALSAVYASGRRIGPISLFVQPAKKAEPPRPQPQPQPGEQPRPQEEQPQQGEQPQPQAEQQPQPVKPPSLEERRAEYDEHHIGFREQRSVTKVEPYEGQFARLLDWPEFYTKVGQADLAERARTRQVWGKTLLGAGVILTIGAAVSFGTQAGLNSCGDPLQCNVGTGGYISGAIFWGVGLAGVLGGSLMPKAVAPAWDARRLGADYNTRLKQSLGLTP
jgi:hypothetical protein